MRDGSSCIHGTERESNLFRSLHLLTLYRLGMDWTKTVVEPIKQVARYSAIRGFIDDFAWVSQDVMLLEGELHLGRKPGFVKYTTVHARDSFARTVLYDINPSQRVKSLAAKVVKRMDELNHGRLWLAGHMRRGDCEFHFASLDRRLSLSSRQCRMGHGRFDTRCVSRCDS